VFSEPWTRTSLGAVARDSFGAPFDRLCSTRSLMACVGSATASQTRLQFLARERDAKPRMRWRSGVGARLRKAMERFRSQLAGTCSAMTMRGPVPYRLGALLWPCWAACIDVALSNQPYRGRSVADVGKSTRCVSGGLSIEPRFRRACRQKTLASVHRPAAPALAPARCRCHARRRDRRRTRRS
jgi:hypothetical protein